VELSPSRALVLSFLLLILVGTAVLSFSACSVPGRQTSMVDALFTATSAVCVTGLSSLDTERHFSRTGQVVILLLIQLGGMGILLFSSSLVMVFGGRLGLRGRLLVKEHLPGLSLAGVARLTRHVLYYIFGFEALGALLLWLAWGPRLGVAEGLYHAVFHSVSAFCNAGFSTWSMGLVGSREDVLVNLVVMGLITVGGVGFLATSELRGRLLERDSRGRLSPHTRAVLVTSLGLVLGGALAIAFFEWDNPRTLGALSGTGRILASFFQSVTCRTAGFNTVDVSALRDETHQLMMILMFVGGAPGSTAGGIKVTTFAILMLATWAQLTGAPDVEISGRRIAPRRILQALALTVVALLSVLVCTTFLNVLEAKPYGALLFETVSALGTVGLSTGITPSLSPASKALLCLAMFAGRVGPLTLASSLVFRTSRTSGRRPEGEVVLG